MKLKYKTDFFISQLGQFPFRFGTQIRVSNENFAAGRFIEPPKNVQKSRFARTGFPGDSYHLPFLNSNIYAIEHIEIRVGRFERPMNTFCYQCALSAIHIFGKIPMSYARLEIIYIVAKKRVFFMSTFILCLENRYFRAFSQLLSQNINNRQFGRLPGRIERSQKADNYRNSSNRQKVPDIGLNGQMADKIDIRRQRYYLELIL